MLILGWFCGVLLRSSIFCDLVAVERIMTFWSFGFSFICLILLEYHWKTCLNRKNKDQGSCLDTVNYMRRSRKFFQRGSNFFPHFLFFCFFCFNEEREDSNTTMSVSSLACQLSVFTDKPVMVQLYAGLVPLWFFIGFRPVLQSNPIFLWFFRGGGLDPSPDSRI